MRAGQLELTVGFSPDGVDSVARRLTTEDDGWTVDGASAFIIFNGIATSLCITSCVSPPRKRNLATLVDDRNYRALMDINISFLSTSMVGFECIWTGVFTTLQIGNVFRLPVRTFRVVVDFVGTK